MGSSSQRPWGIRRLFHVGFGPTEPGQGATGPNSAPGARVTGRESVPGKGQEARYSPTPPEHEAGAGLPGRSVRHPPRSPALAWSEPKAGAQPKGCGGGDAPAMGQGHAPGREGHLRGAPPTSSLRPLARDPRQRCPRRPHLSGMGGGGAGPARCLTHGGDGLEGRWLPGDRPSRWGEFAGGAGTRARAGLLAGCAGLRAGGWRLAPGLGWESDWAPPALGAGRAERGPDVSAGGFVSPQQGPNRSRRAQAGQPSRRLPQDPLASTPGRKPEKPDGGRGGEGWGWRERGVGF